MKTFIFISFLVVLIFSSCQKEINIELNRITNDSTAHITPMFRVVQIERYTVGEDSIIHLFQAVTINGERSVIESEIDPLYPGDTINTVFTYNQQNQLTNIKVSSSAAPTIILESYQLTWNNNRLMKVVGDTLGQFATSFDYSYSPSGSNTAITCVQVPSFDYIDQSVETRIKHRVTVNGQFRPIDEQWINHTYVISNPLPENHHDTTNIYYNYSGNDLASYNVYRAVADTNSAVGLPTNIFRDTAISTYTRSAAGANIADTLRKIYGNDVYTLMSFNLLNLYLTSAFPFNSNIRQDKLFYFRPFNTHIISLRSWWNGIFDSGNSYTNQLSEKTDNSFDAQGRLIRSDVYDIGGTTVDYTLKFTYY